MQSTHNEEILSEDIFDEIHIRITKARAVTTSVLCYSGTPEADCPQEVLQQLFWVIGDYLEEVSGLYDILWDEHKKLKRVAIEALAQKE